jgi:hypothetical protein
MRDRRFRLHDGAAGALLLLATVLGLVSTSHPEVLPKPSYDNTFSLFFVNGFHWRGPAQTAYRPEWDWHTGKLEPWMAEEILKDMLRFVGPPGPYARIGTAASVYPLLWVDPGQNWDFSISGGTAGQPMVTAWRESPGAPLSTTVHEASRDNGLHLLDLVFQPSHALGMPVVVFLHGYNHSPQRWEDNGYNPAIPLDLTAHLEMTHSNCMLYQDGKVSISDNLNGVFEPWDYVEDPAWNGNGHKGTFLTLSRLLDPGVREDYVHRNYGQALEYLVALGQQFPGAITAFTVDPEVEQNNIRVCQNEAVATDFSDNALEEWRLWLRHDGIYDDQTGTYAGEGCPDNGGQGYSSIQQFNMLTGSYFSSWDEVDPRSPSAGAELMDMYLDGGDLDGFFSGVSDTSIQGWGEVMVDHFCEDLVEWVTDALQPHGWDTRMVFTHQIPGGFVDDAVDPGTPWGYYFRMTPLISAQVERGSAGITGFRENTIASGLFAAMRDSMSGDRNWGHFEWNPISHKLDPTGIYNNDYDFWMGAFDTTYSYGCHHVAAYRWWVPPELEAWSSIRPYAQAFRVRGEPVDFQARQQACHDFVQSIRFQPFSKHNDGPGVAPDYDPPPVNGVGVVYLGGEEVALRWSPLIWPDVPQFYWYDPYPRDLWPGIANVFGWPDFTLGRFEVYRDTVALFQPGPENLLSTVSNRDSSYMDPTVSLDEWYYYKILARDNDGTPSIEAQAVAAAPQLEIDPDAIADTVAQGEVAHDTLLIKNGGNFPLSLQAWLENEQGDPPGWMTLSLEADTLLPREQVSLEVALGVGAPSVGDYAGTLLLACNDPFNRLVQVPIELVVDGTPADEGEPGVRPFSVSLRPNPARGHVTFLLEADGATVDLVLYDLTGRLVDRVHVHRSDPGPQQVLWPRPTSVGSGLYFWSATSGGTEARGKLVLLP